MGAINPHWVITEDQVEWTAVRAQGAGGQNVNKITSTIHLRFDVMASSLPSEVKQRLLARADQRMTKQGVLVIKAQQYRTQAQNREDALQRLQQWVQQALQVDKPRRATKPRRASQTKRVNRKVEHGRTKALRRKVKADF